MTTLLYAQINITGIVILFLLLTNMRHVSFKAIPFDQQIFNLCLLLNIFIFVFDTGMWLLDGNPQPALRIGNYLATTLYYLFNPLICFVWLLYTDIKIFESKSGLLKRMRFYIIPVVISSVMSLASPFTGWFFVIDGANDYSRGPLFLLFSVLALLYLLTACGLSARDIIKNGWEADKVVNSHLLIFPIGIFLAAVLQIIFFGLSLIWVCTMLAFISMYINIQNIEIATDHLTGLYNRRRLDQHVHRRVKMLSEKQFLFAILLDLDGFKRINDEYGHILGDKALVEMAGLLRQAGKGSDDFIARMGGDEFIIVGERTDRGAIERLLDEICAATDLYNQSHQLAFPLLISMGYALYTPGETVDAFLTAADKNMYRNKDERKLHDAAGV